jgi:hypothetical protein
MKSFLLIALIALAAAVASPQSKPAPKKRTEPAAHAESACAQILKSTSAEYVASASQPRNDEAELRAIAAYGKCYDERTARLAASLARRGIGPKKAALANLADLEQKLSDFTAKALADTDPPAGNVRAAYAALYQKQFQYEFYESYEEKASKPKTAPRPAAAASKSTAAPAVAAGNSAPKSAAPAASVGDSSQQPANLPAQPPVKIVPGLPAGSASAPPAKRAKPAGPSSSAAPTPPPQPASNPAPPGTSAESSVAAPNSKDVDPFTKAKNHFGELLGSLPPEKLHEVHSAFGKLFNGNPVSEELKVEIYTYAIYLLERPSDKPFAPPPF